MASLQVTADKDSYEVHCSQHGPVALGLRDRTDALTVQQEHLDTFHHPTKQKDSI